MNHEPTLKLVGSLAVAAVMCTLLACSPVDNRSGESVLVPSPGNAEVPVLHETTEQFRAARIDTGSATPLRSPWHGRPSPSRPLEHGAAAGSLPSHAQAEQQTGASSSTLPGTVPGFVALDQTNWDEGDIPFIAPDVNVAVSETHIVAVANASIAICRKSDPVNTLETNILHTVDGFFGEHTNDPERIFDPKCLYDHLDDRFYVIATEAQSTQGAKWYSKLHIAVSDSGDLDAEDEEWTFYEINTSHIYESDKSIPTFVDQPSIGYNDDYIYISGQLVGPGELTYVAAVQKANALSSLAIDPEEFAQTGMRHCQPLISTESTSLCLFAGMKNLQSTGDYGDEVIFLSIVDPFTQNASLVTTQPIHTGIDLYMVPALAQLPNPPGENQRLKPYDFRIYNHHVRDGVAYLTSSSNTPDSNGDLVVAWYEFDHNNWPASGTPPSLAAAGTIAGGEGESYMFPASMTDSHGNVGVVMGHSGPSDYAGIRVATKPAGGGMSSPKTIITGNSRPSSKLPSCGCRWGDYFDITLDPSDDITFWIAGAYEDNHIWQVYVDSFKIACSPADLNADGIINFFDVSLFIQYFDAENPIADFNSDGQFDFFDVSSFLQHYSTGCP